MRFHVYNSDTLSQMCEKPYWSFTPLTKECLSKVPYWIAPPLFELGDIQSIPSCDADQADYFIVPAIIRHNPDFHNKNAEPKIIDYFQSNFSHYKKFPKKHVFICGSDYFEPIAELANNSILYAFSAHKNSNVRCIHYQPQVPVPEKITSIEKTAYDISFQGEIRKGLREELLTIGCLTKYKTISKNVKMWHSKWHKQDIKPLVDEYVSLMHMSKFVFCPKGFGLQTIRFYETLAFGRIPVLISNHAKLPLEDEIDYDKFVVKVDENNLKELESKIDEFIQKNNLTQASDCARKTWEKYFSSKSLNDFFQHDLKNYDQNKF